MKKRLLLLALTLCMALCLLPVAAKAVQIVDSGSCGDDLNYTLTAGGTLTISGTGAIGTWSFQNNPDLTEVIILDGVTEIGHSAFRDCTGLTSITIPNTVTEIGEYAFSGCTGLTSITIPDGVTEISSFSFESCTGLTSITIPDSVTEIGEYAFSGCISLTSITIPDSVTEISGSAFANCTGLTSITIPDSVTKIGVSAFEDCAGLTSITMAGDIVKIGVEAFAGCDNISEAIILQGVTYIPGGIFNRKTQLTSITIPNSVTEIDYFAFSGCTGLTSITLAGDLAEIGFEAFAGCDNVSEAIILQGVTYIPGGIFNGKTKLTSITIPASVKKIGYYTFEECTGLREVTFLGNSPTAITATAFKDVTATCYYPLGNSTWTPEILRNYGGTITWVGYCPEHIWDEGVVAQEPTAAAPGILRYTCTVCGETREEAIAFDSKYVRIYGNDRFQTAFKVADAMKEQLGVEKFTSVIIASGVNFADALSGSYLSAVKNAPILLSFNEVYNDQVKSYIRENMTDDGTIYILGGTGAVPASITTGLERYNVMRLAGDDRFGTNLAILAEAGVEGKDILVCTGLTFADSLSASASKLPILLVWRDLTKDQKAFLAEQEGSKLYVNGGEGAVSEKLEKQVSAYGEVTRLAGGNRFETSTLIAETFFDAPTSVVLAYGWNFPDGLCGGGLAASMNAPMLLTMERYEAAATAYAQAKGIKNSMILGGDGLIPDASVRTIFALTEETPITVK